MHNGGGREEGERSMGCGCRGAVVAGGFVRLLRNCVGERCPLWVM